MKKWMYLIFPSLLLVVFLSFYFMDAKRVAERDRVHALEVQRRDAEEAQKQKDLKERAEADAKKRADERAADLAKKEADKLARWNKAGKDIQDAMDKSTGESNLHSIKIAALEKELESLRTLREKTNQEYLDLLKKVELAKIDRRSAELEIQRMTEMIARRASESSMAKPVLPPPAPAS
jgi:hypothetical protein